VNLMWIRFPRGHIAVRQGLDNLAVAPNVGSIDSLAPARSPLWGFVYPSRFRRTYSRRGHTTTLLLQWVNLVVVPHLGSIDSRITHALALWASSMSRRSRGLHSRRGHFYEA